MRRKARVDANHSEEFVNEIFLDHLPWPPSVNHYWQRNRNGSMRIGDYGLQYRMAMLKIIREKRCGKIGPKAGVRIIALPPDRRKRDLDNILKALLDALTHCGVIADDSCIDCLFIERANVIHDGKIILHLKSME